MSKAELELKYHEITELYELAEELVETVASEFVGSPEEQLALVEPLIETVGESADILSEEFIQVAGKPKARNKNSKGKVEAALRGIYIAIDEYGKQVKRSSQKLSEKIMNIADPIVEKIKRQVEVVIAVFVDFVDISLDRIMQKAHIEELKERQEKIAAMLYSAGYAIE